LAVLIGIAITSTVVAGFLYSTGRSAATTGKLAEARTALNWAASLDPGMALYHRQAGTASLLGGDVETAARSLARATELNPSDDVAWRALAVAELVRGRQPEATHAVERALTTQRSDITNLLLAAEIERAPEGRAARLLAEVVQVQPWIVGGPGWLGALPPATTSENVVDLAGTRWRDGATMTDLPTEQGLWLAAFSGRADFVESAVSASPYDPSIARVAVRTIQCDPTAEETLATLPDGAQRSPLYWSALLRATALEGRPEPVAARMLEIMSGYPVSPAAAPELSPLNENTALSMDRWGYRRDPMTWPVGPVELPSPYAGAALWQFDPRRAAQYAGLPDRLEACG
jgi:tetratricopeptide (TPR) repeat protein